MGVTSQMVVGLCQRLQRKVRIIHNDLCIWEWSPEKTPHGAMIVFSVWGDHAFFYKDTLGAQTLKVGNVSSIPEVKLAYRLDYERVPDRDMEEWEESCFQNSPPMAKIDDSLKRCPHNRKRESWRTYGIVSNEEWLSRGRSPVS